jgi:hypothetical protein
MGDCRVPAKGPWPEDALCNDAYWNEEHDFCVDLNEHLKKVRQAE